MIGLLAILAIGGFAYGVGLSRDWGRALYTSPVVYGQTMPRAAVGQRAPDFVLSDLNGETVSLSSLRGRPVLLFFWTTY